jgi:hypothetical protein
MLIFQFVMKIIFFIQNYLNSAYGRQNTYVQQCKYLMVGEIFRSSFKKQIHKAKLKNNICLSFECYNNIFLMYHEEVHHDFRFVIQDRTLSFKKLHSNAFFVGIRFVH